MNYYIKEIKITDKGTLTREQQLNIERRCRQRVGINFGTLENAKDRLKEVIGISVAKYALPDVEFMDRNFFSIIEKSHIGTFIGKGPVTFSVMSFTIESPDVSFSIYFKIESINKSEFIKKLR